MRVLVVSGVIGMMVLLAGGCSQPNLEEPVVTQEQLFGPTAMRVHPIFTTVRDWTGDDKPDGIEVLVEFQDQFGDPTKGAGTLRFELFTFRANQPDPRGDRIVNPWVGSMVTLDEQRAQWNRTSRTYTFQLAWPQIDPQSRYVLSAVFQSSTGGRFFDRVVLDAQEERLVPTTQPTTAPAGPNVGGINVSSAAR